MGLDMFVFEVTKPVLQKTHYSAAEMADLGHSYVNIEEFDAWGAAVNELRPFCVKAYVTQLYYDLEQIITDHNLPETSHIGMLSSEKIIVGGYRGDKYISKEILRKDIDAKYTIAKEGECYVWHTDEIAYWRKAYDVQTAWHEILDRDVANCGYYEVTDENLQSFREKCGNGNGYRAIERRCQDSGLFYHEWY